MLVTTNKIEAKIEFGNVYTDYNVLVKELDKRDWRKRKEEIAEFRKNIPHLAYIVTNKKELVYLQEKGLPVEPNSKHFEHLERLETYRSVNLLLQLLSAKTSFFPLDEQDGGVYYIVEHKKGRRAKQIVTLSFRVDKAECLQTDVVTFTAIEEVPNNAAVYKVAGKTMQLASSKDKPPFYVKRNRFGKNSVPFFSARKREYAKTKEYFRGILFEDIQKHLGRYMDFSFSKQNVECFKELTQSEKERRNNEVDQIIAENLKAVNIVDYTGTLFEDVKSAIEAFNSDIRVTKSEKPASGKNNIIVTETKAFYEEKGLKDPYESAKAADPFCQVVTSDNIKNDIMRVVLKELLVKQDIKHGRFSFAKEKIGAIRYVYTPLYDENGGIKSYIVMDITKEGFTFREHNLLDRTLASIERIFDRGTSLREVEAVIEDDNDNLNVIYRTNRYPIADSKFMLEYYKNHDEQVDGKWNPRRKEFRPYTAGLYDIVYYKEEGSFFYHIGYNRNSNATLPKASPFREVEAEEGDILIEAVLHSLDEYMVRNKEVTVLPFYMKYAREYADIFNKGVTC